VARVIVVANQKGGVGKTTTAVNLAASLAAAECPTLLIDLDPQANATSSLGFSTSDYEADTYDALLGDAKLGDILLETDLQFLNSAVVHELVGAEVGLRADRERRLERALGRFASNSG
jgi:chromosome partitioning protein